MFIVGHHFFRVVGQIKSNKSIINGIDNKLAKKW